MIAEFGHFALTLALAVALVQATLPLIGAHRRDAGLMALAPAGALAQFALVALAFGTLMHAYIVSDFSLANVVQNSHTAKPMLYKIAGTWGNHEGSMLLWALILSLYGAAVATFGGNLTETLRVRVLSVQGMIGCGILAFILYTSNPFARVDPAPFDGQSLNPLLQDPGLAFHPPLLYLGYVGLSTSFSFAVAAMIEGKVDAAWARWVRPWTLAAWGFLTAGITLGSWWAYYELGWGGWWFWDPVENASFMPWLAATALLHSAIVAEKRDALKAWTVFLAIVAFALSLLGTFLVRSGVLTSVHAFASDPTRGVFILMFLVTTIGAAFALFAWRGPVLVGTGRFEPVSREGALLINNFVLTVAAASILLGTLYPLFLDILNAGKVSVGAPYFQRVFIPMMIPMLLLMAVAPMMTWRRADAGRAVLSLKWAGLIAIALGFGVWLYMQRASALAAFGIAIAAWLFAATVWELCTRARTLRGLLSQPRVSWGMTLAHGGLAIAIAGMTASTAWKVEDIRVMMPGETTEIAGYQFTLSNVSDVRGPNYAAARATFNVRRNSQAYTTLYPEKRIYDVGRQPTTEAAIRPTFWGDLYAVIGDADGNGGYVTRIYFNPLVAWMWTGALIMVLGAGLSLSDRRYRARAPAEETPEKSFGAAA
jgi:cytochrome c-type biogenesis protein CcmF